jgi:23S rRNA pseudouridine1911/1915/1917 synthase
LDKDTSGLLVAAKSDSAYQGLVSQLKTRKLSREYLAIVKGELTGRGTVDAAIGRHAHARKRMEVRPESGRKAVTHFISLQAHEKASLLLLKLETGRTHQIRAHMDFIKHPVLGDSVYGGKSTEADRQMLHAFRLSFSHPKTRKKIQFQADPPKDFAQCVKRVGFEVLSWKKIKWS